MPDRRILAFDTSAAHCAAALLTGDRIVADRFEPMAKGQAERLMPMLEDMLAEAGTDWAMLDGIGVGTGPGNFTGVFFGTDFVTVTKSDGREWDHLKPALLGAIMEHYQSGAPVMDDGSAPAASGHAEHTGEDSAIVDQIKELLDTRVRPAVAQDGGDITFHGFDRGVVYLHMQGACAGCPSSTLTLKMGIENLLRHYIPEVVEVRPVA